MALPAVGMQRNRDFADLRAGEARLDDHFGGELHARAPLIQTLVQRLREAAETAVDVVDRCAEPSTRDAREQRVAKPAMQPRHRARQHASSAGPEPAPLHELVAGAQPLDELRQLAEVVAVVGISHDHEPAACRRDAAHEGGAVTLVGHEHHSRAGVARDGDGVVRTAVVGDDDLADDAGVRHGGMRPVNARRHRVGLVETRHDHGQFDAIARSLVWERWSRE